MNQDDIGESSELGFDIEDSLWHQLSAGRVGVKDFDSIVVDSPFDYENKTMLICPDDAPDASSPDYNSYLINKLDELLMYTGGRMLVLFTSFETMNQTAQN